MQLPAPHLNRTFQNLQAPGNAMWSRYIRPPAFCRRFLPHLLTIFQARSIIEHVGAFTGATCVLLSDFQLIFSCIDSCCPSHQIIFFWRVSQRSAPSNPFTSVGNRAWRQRIGRVQGCNTRLHRLLCTRQQLQVVGRLLLQNRVPVLSCQVVAPPLHAD